ncbi:GtrA family protein [Nonomuraea roseoviolacea]|uniref:Flippase GtrA n=1 Tax=Nonomuraea roseoviolacea subsp. carminata TaxID=160689 RepID=A0ABT1K654_9ACTN|nr:GtrA family protein [Nonomuraea roseoviolacea]MCP2349152.1 putative flippase GtrA [Nonomuraea roseoviolacea subsp. carminata]
MNALTRPPAVRPAARPGMAHRLAYLAGGGVTAVIYYGILAAALAATGGRVPYLLLVVASHLVTVVIVYPWYRLVVFPGAGHGWLAGYLRFYAAGLSILSASLVGLPILVELAGLPVLAAQALIITLTFSCSYALHRAWTFRRRGSSRRGRERSGNPAHNLRPKRSAARTR